MTLTTVNYTITGPNSFSKTGSINVASSNTVSAIIGGLPAGSGFTITLSGTGTDGTTNCLGSAPFNVTAGAVTMVSVVLDCHQAAKTGSIAVNGNINVCPNLDSLSASPAEVAVGSSLSLWAVADDPDSGPSPLAYSWTASSGTLTGANTASPSFKCLTTGAATVSVTVSDGDPLVSCAARGSVQVTCSGHNDAALLVPTATPIKHVVVVFGENISFDHYFGTYPTPNAAGALHAGGGHADRRTTWSRRSIRRNGFSPLAGVDLLHSEPNGCQRGQRRPAAINPFRLVWCRAGLDA